MLRFVIDTSVINTITGYFNGGRGFFFWLDLISTVTLVFDIGLPSISGDGAFCFGRGLGFVLPLFVFRLGSYSSELSGNCLGIVFAFICVCVYVSVSAAFGFVDLFSSSTKS